MNERLISQMDTERSKERGYRKRAWIVAFVGWAIAAFVIVFLILKTCATPQSVVAAEGVSSPETPTIPPPCFREFAAYMVAERGHPSDAREIANAILDVGCPQLPLPTDEAVCLLLAVIDVESDFRIKVRGDGGRAVGLMQWHYRLYAKYSGCEKRNARGRVVWSAEYHEPNINMLVGATVLSHRLAHADMWLAVSRYNSPGARRVNAYGRLVRRDYTIYRLQLKDWEPPEWMTRL